MDANYHQAFLETLYTVKKSDMIPEVVVIRIGNHASELEAIMPHLNSWAFITAFNPLPEILSHEENLQRNKNLMTFLIGGNFRLHPGVGISGDGRWQEESFLIENIDREEAKSIAKQFGQLAFVWGRRNECAELVYTSVSN